MHLKDDGNLDERAPLVDSVTSGVCSTRQQTPWRREIDTQELARSCLGDIATPVALFFGLFRSADGAQRRATTRIFSIFGLRRQLGPKQCSPYTTRPWFLIKKKWSLFLLFFQSSPPLTMAVSRLQGKT